MPELISSWRLKEEIAKLPASELKEEIDLYIKLNDEENTGKAYCLGNLFYRANLHYIIDNINKQGLLEELRGANNATKEKLSSKVKTG